ncbi:MAG: VWA domain-containing protein [Galbibacter orientalis]|uniref:VWA domain-containing protein n=1 Tax=Galbibacter orientalis TaxID=453852 RepID=UPI0030018EDA
MYKDLLPINWSDFHFLRPQFLWLLLPVVVLMVISLLSMQQELKWKRIIAPHLRPYVISKGSNAVKVFMHLVLLLAFASGILGLSGPTWKKIEVPGQKLETPMVVLLDISQSMMADDIQPNRLERAKFKIKDLIKYNPRARMALVGFAGTAHTIVPLTKDYEIINSHIEGLKPSTMPFPGSDLEAALILGDSLTKVTKAPGTIVVFSDDFREKERGVLSNFAKNSKNKIVILPMSTPGGSEIPSARGKGFIKGKDGKTVRSNLDATLMASLNEIEGITVQQLTLDDSDVELIAKDISKNLEFTEKNEEKDNDWRDVGLLFIIPMAVLLLLWFRKGWVLYSLTFLLLVSCNDDASNFSDLWYTKDYQGQRLSNKGDFKEAADVYKDPLRKGVAYFKAGDYEAAINSFSKDTTAMGAYNLGLSYFKNGDYAAAELAFNIAVEKDPSLEAAKVNRQKLMQVLPEEDQLSVENAQESKDEKNSKNTQNKSPEDLSGGGQEASKEDMKKERQEETVNSNIHKGKELDEVPDDIKASIPQDDSKILMRKVDDDPTLFLQRKFKYQVKKYNIKPKSNEEVW